jgi:hypothetical protein
MDKNSLLLRRRYKILQQFEKKRQQIPKYEGVS